VSFSFSSWVTSSGFVGRPMAISNYVHISLRYSTFF
jgi:hypothetical protein